MTAIDVKKAKAETLRSLRERQRMWAAGARVEMERPDYTGFVDGNLFAPLSESARAALTRAQGGELRRSADSPPKFHALHSSSALVANVFDYWQGRSLSALSTAMRSSRSLQSIEVESKFSTGYGFPCNLDVVLRPEGGDWILAVESKFTEPFGPSKSGLRIGYVPLGGDSAWKKRGLTQCDDLARDLQRNPDRFHYLDVPQLLKHILGLHRAMGRDFRLLYLYYTVDAAAGDVHAREVDEFADAVAGEIDFDSLTYQELIARLLEAVGRDSHIGYFDYLEARYRLPGRQ